MPLRQTTGFVQSLLRLVGLDWSAPDFSTLCRQKTLNVSLPYRGGSKRRIWRKIHIGIDEETLEVRAVEVTSSNIGDAPMLPELLNQIPLDQDIGNVTANGVYDTRKCHEAIAARNAHAVISPRKNAKPWKPTSAKVIARNDAVHAQRYLGRTVWRRWSGYHRRRRVETKMYCMNTTGPIAYDEGLRKTSRGNPSPG